jgi:hypothetical protein
MYTDAQRFRKLLLRQTSESTEGDDVPRRINLATQDALALDSRNRAREISVSQLGYIINH